MGSKGNVGCLGVVGLLIVVSMIISFIVFLLGVAAVVAGLGAAGWMISSAVSDLRHRSRLGSGSDPLQVTGDRAKAIADSSHTAARDALSSTLTDWHHFTVTRGIGTPSQNSYDQLERQLSVDLEFQDVALRAESAHSRSLIDPPDFATGIARSIVELDRLNSEFRQSVHRATRRAS